MIKCTIIEVQLYLIYFSTPKHLSNSLGMFPNFHTLKYSMTGISFAYEMMRKCATRQRNNWAVFSVLTLTLARTDYNVA